MENFWKDIVNFFATASADMALKILGAALITLIGFKLIKLFRKMLIKPLEKSKFDKGILSFMENAVSILLRFILIISVLMYLGVPAASFIAILSTFGLAVGLALQGSLSNFAGGLTILFFHPFRAGDFIKTDSAEGAVQNISIMYTTLKTLDGKKVVIPNAMLSNGVITDFSWYETRRVDLSIMTDFKEDSQAVCALMEGVAHGNPLVLSTPAPAATLDKIQDGVLLFTLRCWVKNGDYWKAMLGVTAATKDLLNKEGIIVRSPIRDLRQI